VFTRAAGCVGQPPFRVNVVFLEKKEKKMKRVIACLLVLVVCTVASASEANPAKVFEWAFEGNVADTAGAADGTWSGAAAYDTGRWGQAAVIGQTTGVKGDLATGVTDLFNNPYGDNGWTMNVWVNLSDATFDDWSIIAGVGNSSSISGSRLIHQSDPSKGDVIQFSGCGPWGFLDDTTATYALNDWTMVTVVAKWSAFSVYVDGVHKTGNQLDAWFNAPDLSGDDVFVGMLNQWASDKFEGLVDEYTIWDGPMVQDQITSMYLTNTIPEPATLALLGFGALSLIRRKK